MQSVKTLARLFFYNEREVRRMERVTFEEYEAAKAAVLYGKEYEETSSMENNVIHKQYVCKDGSGISGRNRQFRGNVGGSSRHECR